MGVCRSQPIKRIEQTQKDALLILGVNGYDISPFNFNEALLIYPEDETNINVYKAVSSGVVNITSTVVSYEFFFKPNSSVGKRFRLSKALPKRHLHYKLLSTHINKFRQLKITGCDVASMEGVVKTTLLSVLHKISSS